MLRLPPNVVAQWLEQDCNQPDFCPLLDILIHCLRKRLKKASDEEIAELAESLRDSVTEALHALWSEHRSEGVEPRFEISSDEGGAYYRTLEGAEAPLLRSLRKTSPENFEIFCKKVLARLGGAAVVSGGPHDGGVDFYAFGVPLQTRAEPMPPSARLVVIGQSKRYSATHEVSEVDLRAFVGAVMRKSMGLRLSYSDRFGLLTPVLLAFWTTGFFTEPARAFAREMGIWYLNGIALSQFAHRLGFAVSDIPTPKAEEAGIAEIESAVSSAHARSVKAGVAPVLS